MSAAEILIIDFGGSEREILLTEIEARGLTAESHGPGLTASEIEAAGYRAIIFCGKPTLEGMKKTGGVRPGIPFDKKIFQLELPILAINFAARVMMQLKRGQVAIPGDDEDGAWHAESEPLLVELIREDRLLRGFPPSFEPMSCSPYFIKSIPETMTLLARAPGMPHLISGDLSLHHYALDIQVPTAQKLRARLLDNFLFDIVGLRA